MKTLWFIPMLLFLVLPEVARAQTYPVDRGSWIVGGSGSFSSQGDNQADDDGRTTQVLFNPSVEFFVLPGLAVGGALSISHSSDDRFTNTGLGVGSSVSYYFGRGQRSVYPFISAGVAISDISFEFEDGDSGSGADLSTTGTTLDVSGGVTLMVAKNVGLTGKLFFLQQNIRGNDDDNDPVFAADFDLDMFGLRFGVATFVF